MLHFEAVRSGIHNRIRRVFRVGIWVRIADVFQRHALAHDAAFEVADADGVLGDDFAAVFKSLAVTGWAAVEKNECGFMFLHALEEIVGFFAEGFGGDDGLFFGHGL